MATTPYDIIAGPADVWLSADLTASFPAVNAAEGAFDSEWVKLGMTDGGVKVKHTQSIDLIRADQRTGPVKAIRSEEGLEIAFNIEELTLEHWAYALNGNAITTASTPNRSTLKMYQGLDVTQFMVLVRGPSPYMNAFLQYNVPVVVQTDEPEAEYKRDGQAVLAFKFVALEDPNAATSADRFGSIIAQTS